MTKKNSYFENEWLDIREPVDARSRSSRLADAAGDWLARYAPNPVPILDLGAGSGANLRYLAPRWAMPQCWTLIDHDAELLSRAAGNTTHHAPDASIEVTTRTSDLTDALGDLPAGGLVTAAALFDLVTADWVETLSRACRTADCAVLFALSVDDQVRVIDNASSSPDMAAVTRDRDVLARVAAHQKSDKGMGRALGPEAPAKLRESLTAAGYHVFSAVTPWRIDSDDAALGSAAINEWAAAATAEAPATRAENETWAAHRRADLTAGRCTLEIGHQDVLGLPIEQ